MRLIDADVQKEILHGKRIEFVKHPTFVRSDMEEGIDRGIGCALLAINDAPTVDAIPVEWIKARWRNKYSERAICERWLIEDWQKEQEAKHEQAD